MGTGKTALMKSVLLSRRDGGASADVTRLGACHENSFSLTGAPVAPLGRGQRAGARGRVKAERAGSGNL